MTKNLFKLGTALAAFALFGFTATVAKADASFDTSTSWNGTTAGGTAWTPDQSGSTVTEAQVFNIAAGATNVGGPYGTYFDMNFSVEGTMNVNASKPIKFIGQIYAWNSTTHTITGSALWTSATQTFQPVLNTFQTLRITDYGTSGNPVCSALTAGGSYIFVLTGVTSSGILNQGVSPVTSVKFGQSTTTTGGAWLSTQTTQSALASNAMIPLTTSGTSATDKDLSFSGSFSSAPEGSSLAMLAMGGLPLLGMGVRRLRKK